MPYLPHSTEEQDKRARRKKITGDDVADMIARWIFWIVAGWILLSLGSRGWGF